MNSRLMYSRVMFETGRKSVVPGLFAFQWLKTNRPGRPVGICGAAGVEAASWRPRTSSRIQSTCGVAATCPGGSTARPSSGIEVPHVEEVEAVVVGEEELGAVVGARARPGAGGPLDQRVGAHGGVDVAQVEAGQAGAGDQQQGLLELGERHRLVGARVREGAGHLHPEPHAAALAVEDRLEEGVGEGVVEARGVGQACAHSPSSLLMISCWISLVPSVIEASLASR